MKYRFGAGGVAERADSPRTASHGRMNDRGFRRPDKLGGQTLRPLGWQKKLLHVAFAGSSILERPASRVSGNYEWRGWRDGNGVSAIWVEWASGAGNGSGARIGTGDFAGVGECWS